MLPAGYVGIVVCDTRRALRWERALERAGCRPRRVEASGAAAEKGDWQIAVPERFASQARGMVSAVVNGDADLPHVPLLSRSGWIALLAIGAVGLGLVLAGFLR